MTEILEKSVNFMRGKKWEPYFTFSVTEMYGSVCLCIISSDQGVSERDVMTRIMIFATFRDSVNEITELLNRHRPLVRAMSFIGQSTGKTTKGFTQKEQLKVLETFS